MAKDGKKRNKVVIPEGETKAARFIRVVTPRISRATKAIKLIGYCSSSAYEFTEQQTEQIISALSAAVKTLADKFANKKASDEVFKFKQ